MIPVNIKKHVLYTVAIPVRVSQPVGMEVRGRHGTRSQWGARDTRFSLTSRRNMDERLIIRQSICT